MKQDSAPSFEFGCIFNFCIYLYIISHLRDTLHPPRIEVQPKSKIQYAGFDLSRRSRSTENAETCIVSAELSWRVKRVEGPYGAASGEADRSTLLPLRERNLRAATTPLPGGSSCAHASEHTHIHTQPSPCKLSPQRTRASPPSDETDYTVRWKDIQIGRWTTKRRPLTSASLQLFLPPEF